MKRPQTYQQWRAEFKQALMDAGAGMLTQMQRGERFHTTRYVYQDLRRAARIEKQLEAEFDARTTSCMEALLEMIFRKDIFREDDDGHA